MDYIVENKDLFPVVIKAIIKECEYYTPEENQIAEWIWKAYSNTY